MMPRCPHCKSTEGQIKSGRNRKSKDRDGRTPEGTQRYKCKNCNRTYTPEPKNIGYANELREKAINLHLKQNLAIRKVSEVLKISPQTIINWIEEEYASEPEERDSDEDWMEL